MGGSGGTQRAIRAAKEAGTLVDRATVRVMKKEKDHKRNQVVAERKRLDILTSRLDLYGNSRSIAGLEHLYVQPISGRTQLTCLTVRSYSQRRVRRSSMRPLNMLTVCLSLTKS